MNLIADIGNSRIKLSVTEKGSIIASKTSESDGMEALHELWSAHPGIGQAIISSVRKDDEGFVNRLKERIPRVLELKPGTPVPLKIDYKTPQTLGMDRIAAACGAFFLYPGRNLLAIDAGTAITMDLVDKEGRYLGGKISPGIFTRFRSLHAFTGKLPLLEPSKSWSFPGKDTEESIQAGVLEGALYEVESTIYKLQSRIPDLNTVLTGGDADFFAVNLKNTIFVHQNLNITGLDSILEFNS